MNGYLMSNPNRRPDTTYGPIRCVWLIRPQSLRLTVCRGEITFIKNML